MAKSYTNNRDSYKFYKTTTENPVDIQTYLDIAGDYSKFLMEKVLEGEEVVLPGRLGTLSVQGKKQKITFDEEGKVIGLAPNWPKTKELWKTSDTARANKKIVFHTNEDTSGIRYKYLWSKRNVLVKNKTLYSLQLTRTNKRNLSAKIKGGKEYLTK
tara:strand:+ start:5369 stop:5839 length:471 start_codon:yes stop_codon:yes gene_type:complete